MKAVMRDEREMKDSGIEWINLMPKTWRLAKIGAFFDITLGKMLESKRPQDSDASLENYICATNLKWNGIDSSTQKQMWFSKSEKNQYLLEKNDILVMEGGLAGTSSIYHGEMSPCYMQNSVNRCRKKSTVNNIFLYYWLYNTYHLGYVESICNRATIMHYTKEKLSKTPLVVPTVKESGLIGNYLEGRCGKIDAIIAEAKASIEEYKELKQAVITNAVTGMNVTTDKFKDSKIGWIEKIPANWTSHKLSNVVTTMRNGYVGPTRDLFQDTGIKYIQSLHVKDGVIDFGRGEYFVSEKWGAVHPKIYTDDIVIVQTGDIGQVGLVSDEYDGCNCHALIIVTPLKDIISPKYLMYFLRSYVGKEGMLLNKTGALLPHLNAGKIKYTPIICPVSVEEQENIVANLDIKCSKIDSLISEKQSLIEDLEAYKKSLIYEVVTGKRKVVE